MMQKLKSSVKPFSRGEAFWRTIPGENANEERPWAFPVILT